MAVTDSRLCDGMSTPEIIENFNRVLALLDEQAEAISEQAEAISGQAEAISGLDERVTALENPEDPEDPDSGEGDEEGGGGA